MKISIKRAKYFITCNGKYFNSSKIFKKELISGSLIFDERCETNKNNVVQLSLFNPTKEDKIKCLTGEF